MNTSKLFRLLGLKSPSRVHVVSGEWSDEGLPVAEGVRRYAVGGPWCACGHPAGEHTPSGWCVTVDCACLSLHPERASK